MAGQHHSGHHGLVGVADKKLREQLTVVNYVLSITFARLSWVCLRVHGCAYKLCENICQFLAPSARLNALAFHVWGLHTTPAQKGFPQLVLIGSTNSAISRIHFRWVGSPLGISTATGTHPSASSTGTPVAT